MKGSLSLEFATATNAELEELTHDERSDIQEAFVSNNMMTVVARKSSCILGWLYS